MAIAALLAAAPGAAAAVPFKDIASGGPLTHVYVGNDLSCQVAYQGDSRLELYPPAATPGDCGTFVAVGGTLYAPDFANHDTTATGSLGATTPFTPVSQTDVTGSGTSASPYRVVTVVDVGSTGLRITQTDSYVTGQEAYRTDIAISNTSGAAQSAVLYRAGDCFLQESDTGFGFVQENVAPGCSINANNSPAGRIEQWVPITSGANHMEAGYSEVWSHIATQAPFPNTCRCTESIDNGAGISWSVTVPASGTARASQGSATRSHWTTFSPRGVAGAPGTTTPPPPRERCGRSGIPTGPQTCLQVPEDITRFGCLRQGDFRHRFRVRLKKSRGGLLLNRVSRVVVVFFSLDRRTAGADRRRPYYAFVDGRRLTQGTHTLRADVRLRIPRYLQRRFPGRFRRTAYRKRLRYRFRTCAPGTATTGPASFTVPAGK